MLLSFRGVISIIQKIPSDAPERCELFLSDMQDVSSYDLIINMKRLVISTGKKRYVTIRIGFLFW